MFLSITKALINHVVLAQDSSISLLLRSPDGSCVLTNSDDDILRLFNISEDIINNSPEEELVSA